MSKDNKFINEALSDIDEAIDHENTPMAIELDAELMESAKDLQKVLGLSKDVFFNALASYGAYCCTKNDFDEKEFPKEITGTKISFELSTQSETKLEELASLNNSLIIVFGLIQMSNRLL